METQWTHYEECMRSPEWSQQLQPHLAPGWQAQGEFETLASKRVRETEIREEEEEEGGGGMDMDAEEEDDPMDGSTVRMKMGLTVGGKEGENGEERAMERATEDREAETAAQREVQREVETAAQREKEVGNGGDDGEAGAGGNGGDNNREAGAGGSWRGRAGQAGRVKLPDSKMEKGKGKNRRTRKPATWMQRDSWEGPKDTDKFFLNVGVGAELTPVKKLLMEDIIMHDIDGREHNWEGAWIDASFLVWLLAQ
ncbi:hypothetical protein FA15DRAFT_711013 [Coprinopsis marcescibilis]|uniref:Uncharacterized protein n=1 Tax=Coprinopsis marcescibilis TaxID=230819 RepID=A0A5C3KBF0_COPMA|nr:hypothetical protein FA15DRAFT_711013 [Coprinopsis marcescibilis]